jgi:hypothetical protein
MAPIFYKIIYVYLYLDIRPFVRQQKDQIACFHQGKS